MFVQLNKCVVACGSALQRGHSGDGCLTLTILFKYERSRGHLFALCWARVQWVALAECCFGVMYCEWCGKHLFYIIN